ncbi:fluoride efflux transporter CrcB [Alicyclobacillus fastidiosus]|uniref:Fluoride-specific ion channel FluC n=1 Tax=Alicyclobacillus fastidiosus TaxID=392011 RepID=A0ABY6ZLG5_9BACL|nr:fluoride efflux transporter CrcB [Alicyclobacillus fastidiosus]WAH43753.1 fluoride efflux transporter CrcB [Alicyclobacillus fastidiosus]GMA59971.1 putative fluoride ion transporter CrcB 2 [Alicyclobacillus fastidiosus]
MNWLLVGIGGIIGALLRFQVSRFVNDHFDVNFPFPTLLINVTGSFLLGWFTRDLNAYFPALGSAPMLLFGVGVCGAYTTFSTFSYEAVSLFREQREITALVYIAVSCLGGFAASALGLYGLPAR